MLLLLLNWPLPYQTLPFDMMRKFTLLRRLSPICSPARLAAGFFAAQLLPTAVVRVMASLADIVSAAFQHSWPLLYLKSPFGMMRKFILLIGSYCLLPRLIKFTY